MTELAEVLALGAVLELAAVVAVLAAAEVLVLVAVLVLAEVPVEVLEIWDREITTAMVLATAQATAASDPRMALDLARAPNLDGVRTSRDFGG